MICIQSSEICYCDPEIIEYYFALVNQDCVVETQTDLDIKDWEDSTHTFAVQTSFSFYQDE